ncbi:amidohydrolase family protein [Thalassotalea profundi]|uniref:Bifunctional TolB-family protein/amidohydrolase n=1 Tax=Thalassotalea profundi TaxID=2036687 RepID=A0ABQ3ITI5_9GAMM|nr:amidohydrolase family protein [Thalassotalea profundi]GHE93662.1 bifunctional TolB-family protein/amidohydrolase [Thalassotalea profundi]
MLSTTRSKVCIALSLVLSITLSTSTFAQKENSSIDTQKEKKWSVNEPQGVFKSASIDVTQGTWMNIDVSPDGKTVVFDLLGDIYTMPILGGEAKALMTDIAWQMQPRFSPDGKHIAFTSDEDGGDNLWVMKADGSEAKAVTDESFRLLNSPAWSPDGNYLVGRKHYSSRRSLGAGEVWLYHKTGGSGVKLTKRPNDQKDLGEPAFSADGKYVYFSQDATPGKTFHYSKDSVQGIYKIKRLELETGEIDTIISGKGGAIRPTPSPDGKTLAFISRDDFDSNLYLYDLASGKQTLVYEGLERDMQETWAIHGVYPTIAWTPDNKGLVFWAGGKIHRLDIANKKAMEIPFHVKTEKKIQQALRFKQNLDQKEFDLKMLRDIEISPDGKQVVFEALGHIYVRDLKNGKPKRLTKQNDHFEFSPSFSRDGKKIVYVTWDDKDLGKVKVISSRGGKGKTITAEKGKYIDPSFSPDGKQIVYRKVRGGAILNPEWGLNAGVYVVDSKGGKPSLVTDNGLQPHFGGRSDRIYLTRSGAMPHLVRVDLDGQHEKKLYQGKFATEYKVSPDGKFLAFAERFNVFVTPLVERGEVIDIGPKAKNLPVEKLSVRAGEGINWNGGSDEIYWSLGNELYQAKIDQLFSLDKQDESTDKATLVSTTQLGFTQKVDIPSGIVAFVGGKVVTMQGDKVLTEGVVVVENNKIVSVGAKGEVSIPKAAKIIDITGKSIIPGLIDAHAHGSQGSSEIIPQQNWKNYAGLTFGVTTIHDPSNDTTEFFAASEMQKAGAIVAPRLFSTGAILYGATAAGLTSHVDKLDDAKFHIERLQKAGAFSVKSYNQPRRNQRQQFIQAAREANMMVVPEGGSLLQHNLTMVVDGHTTLEHSIPSITVYDDIKQLWSQSAMAYTPTLVVAYGGIWGENYWYDKTEVWRHPRLSQYVPSEILAPRAMRRTTAPDHHYNHFNVAKTAKIMNDVGVKVNAGGHGQREGLAMHWEIWMMAQGGMSPLEALATATINSAESLGLDMNLGSIEAGKLADLVVVDGDITQDIRVSDKVVFTMLNGRVYDAESMNEIGNYDKKREKFYFEK